MPRHVAMFGSINVGGNRLKMADLRTALAESPCAQDGAENLVHVYLLDGLPAPEAFAKLISDLRGADRIGLRQARRHSMLIM